MSGAANIRGLIADLEKVRSHHEFTRDRIGQPGCDVRKVAGEHVETLDQAITLLSDLYALGLMAEEMGEVIQLIGKWLRFGPDHARKDGDSARSLMPIEMGDVAAAMDFACLDGIAAFRDVIGRREGKKAKLLNPESRDDQGRRLAPEPRGRRHADPS